MYKFRTAARRCIGLFLALLLFCCGSTAAFADELSELREKQESLEVQKKELDEKLEELKNNTTSKKIYREALFEQIQTVQKQLDLLREEIEEQNLEISRTEEQIAEKQAGIDENMDLLKARIHALYVTGDATTVSLILDSKSLMDFADKIHILKAVTRHDRQLIDELNSQMKEVQDDLDKMNLQRQELGERKKELDSKNEELSALYKEAGQLVADAESEELTAKNASEILGSQMAENEAAIAKLEEQIRAEQSLSGGGTGYVGTGSFIWPMPGYTYLTCYFGEDGHRGIDIAGGDIYGKPIVAADGGTVTYAGWNDSYGYCVFMDHGNGYETRYAHMSALGTETGATVEQGEILGYVGSTGYSTGPHLHFEVIYADGLTDPMGYF